MKESFEILCATYSYEPSLDMPDWTSFKVASCTEIMNFLTEHCYDKHDAWIPFSFLNKTRIVKPRCIRCRHMKKIQNVCEHDPDVLRPLFTFDTRACTHDIF